MKSQEQKTLYLVIFSKNFPQIYFFGSCYFNFNFFAVFSKMRHTISTLPVISSFMKIFVAQISRTRFFFNCWKLNIFAIFKSIILIFQWIFLWYLSTSFVKKKSNPTIRELRGQHLGEFQQRISKLFDMDSISLFIMVP